ncbi:MAG TPA: hypothetical protein VFO89_09480 [Thermoanaerobaculia bacterium]|nr:hypothetical protein [Thermoanaerobaculia bacterium]
MPRRQERSRLHRDPVLAPLVLQPRDLAILRDAFLHRFASTPALLLSAFAASNGRGMQYACKRLSLLWRAGYIERFRSHHSMYLHGSEPFLYAMGSGKASAAARTGLPPHAISQDRWRAVLAEATPARERTRAALLAAGVPITEIDRGLHNTTEILLKHYSGTSSGVQHYVLTSDLAALLWFSARRHGWSVDDIQPDGVADLSMRDPEPHRSRALITAHGILPIQPDCLFTIAGHRLAIEAETGSTSRAALTRKLHRYARRFEITEDPTTRVLVHCATEAHAELTLTVIGGEIPSAQRARFLVSYASATRALLRASDESGRMLTAPVFHAATAHGSGPTALFARSV